MLESIRILYYCHENLRDKISSTCQELIKVRGLYCKAYFVTTKDLKYS